MGGKIRVLLWLCLLGLIPAEVILRGEWKKNFGWYVTCSWQTVLNDTLQSVRMYRNDIQFLVYRPETHGAEFYDTSVSDAFMLTTHCVSSTENRRGECVVQWQPHQNATEDTYRCEISGERPTFRLEEMNYTVFAPPTAAVMKHVPTASDHHDLYNTSQNHRLSVNCTSSGLPPPRLLWTIEGQKIPEDFTHTVWNSTTKLWDSWSSYNPQDYNVKVVCTPEVTTKSGRLVRGSPAEWAKNSVGANYSKLFILVCSIMAASLFR